MIGPMVADKNRYAIGFSLINKRPRLTGRGRQRLLDQDRAAVSNCFKSLPDTKRGGRCQNQPIRLLRYKQVFERVKTRNTPVLCVRTPFVAGIHHTGQGHMFQLVDGIRVTSTNQAHPSDCNLNSLHWDSPP